MGWPAGSFEASIGHVHHKFHCMGMDMDMDMDDKFKLWHSSVFERSSIALGFRNVDCPVQWNGMAAGSFSGFACALHGRWHFKIIASALRIVLNSAVELE